MATVLGHHARPEMFRENQLVGTGACQVLGQCVKKIRAGYPRPLLPSCLGHVAWDIDQLPGEVNVTHVQLEGFGYTDGAVIDQQCKYMHSRIVRLDVSRDTVNVLVGEAHMFGRCCLGKSYPLEWVGLVGTRVERGPFC
jgi:hypothetical protein